MIAFLLIVEGTAYAYVDGRVHLAGEPCPATPGVDAAFASVSFSWRDERWRGGRPRCRARHARWYAGGGGWKQGGASR
jgi:hypothetical protein